ncbi:MAG: translin family protein [Methanomassiliicoccales archaeon]|nr:translin family protein [Methanomassiliicoccales archaeon]NYT15072.1 translin family protein [Methanomassiliicoccales archaeon]
MRNLDEIAIGIQDELDEKDTVREIAIKSSRAIIRLSGGAVHSIHKGEDASDMLATALEEAARLKSLLEVHPDIWTSGLVSDALQELAEAAIVHSIFKCERLPAPHELGIPPTPYLLGLADSIGEIRRFVLIALRRGEVDEAITYLDMMEEMFLVIMRFDYPQALVAIRRKQDIARSLVEKTRGDITLAVSSRRLEEKIEDLQKRL